MSLINNLNSQESEDGVSNNNSGEEDTAHLEDEENHGIEPISTDDISNNNSGEEDTAHFEDEENHGIEPISTDDISNNTSGEEDTAHLEDEENHGIEPISTDDNLSHVDDYNMKANVNINECGRQNSEHTTNSKPTDESPTTFLTNDINPYESGEFDNSS